MTKSILKTTGGVLHQEDLTFIYSTICEVFNCSQGQIKDLKPLQKGLSNSVLTFDLNGGKYVFRFPGLGSEVLIDRGRESMIQSQDNDARVDTPLVAMSVSKGWKIARYINSRGFDYKNISDGVRGIRLLHKLHNIFASEYWISNAKSSSSSTKCMTNQDNPTEFFLNSSSSIVLHGIDRPLIYADGYHKNQNGDVVPDQFKYMYKPLSSEARTRK